MAYMLKQTGNFYFLDSGCEVHLIQSHRTGKFEDIPQSLKGKKGFTCDIVKRKVFDRNKFIKRYINDVLYAFSAMRYWVKVKDAEVIVYATPIYYYEMAGQMKTLLDRLNPLYPSEYAFRDIYMIATAAEDEESAFEKAYSGLKGWVDCFGKAKLKGLVTGGGISAPNEAGSHKNAMQKAYELGKRL